MPVYFQQLLPFCDVSLVLLFGFSKDVNTKTSEDPSPLLLEKYYTILQNVSNCISIYTASYSRKLECLLLSLRNSDTR